MQTEIAKYHLINQYLKGQLSEKECIDFEKDISLNPDLHAEVEMHRMLNEAIIDNYLLDVKQKTKNVIRERKAQKSNLTKIVTLGMLILVGGVGLIYFYPKPTTDKELAESKQNIWTTKPDETKLNQTITNNKTEPKKGLNTIKEPTKPNSITKEILSQTKDEPAFVPVQISEVRSDLNAKPVVNESHSQKEKVLIEKKPTVDEKPISAPIQKQEIPEKRQDIQLILNISRNETVVFPVEEGFAGEIEIMNENGTKIWHSSILNGQPNTWDGLSILGGQVTSGQYVFLLKDVEGNLRNQGFITVVR